MESPRKAQELQKALDDHLSKDKPFDDDDLGPVEQVITNIKAVSTDGDEVNVTLK